MNYQLICRISLLTIFFVTLPLLAVGAPVLPGALQTIQSTKTMGLLEPGTLLLLALGGSGMVYLNKRKRKISDNPMDD